MIQIPEWQLKHIENALRLTSRINKCRGEETAFDREVIKAYSFVTEALANADTRTNRLHKHDVIKSVCPDCNGLTAIMGTDGVFRPCHCQSQTVL